MILNATIFHWNFSNVTNIDISAVVIKQMQTQIQDKTECTLKYMQMDALNMSFENESFTVVLDKGTLDALMSDEKSETIMNTVKYFNEIQRVLRTGGRYICISLLQEHIMKALLDYFPTNNWMFRVVRCFEAEKKAYESGENPMPVFVIICTKFKSLPNMVSILQFHARLQQLIYYSLIMVLRLARFLAISTHLTIHKWFIIFCAILMTYYCARPKLLSSNFLNAFYLCYHQIVDWYNLTEYFNVVVSIVIFCATGNKCMSMLSAPRATFHYWAQALWM